MNFKRSILRLILVLCVVFSWRSQVTAAEIGDVDDGGTIPPGLMSNNINDAQAALPELQKLWPAHPKTYFSAATQAVHALGENHDPASRQALLSVFTDMTKKQCPTNGSLAVGCLQEKCSAVLEFLNLDEVRNSSSNLMAIATFVGQIRQQTIPNYKPKIVYINPRNDLGLSGERLQKAIEQNEQNKTVNYLQQELQRCNNVLTFHLIHNVKRLGAASGDKEFVRNVVSKAHLNEREEQALPAH